MCITVSEPSPESKAEGINVVAPTVGTAAHSLELPESEVSIIVTDPSPDTSEATPTLPKLPRPTTTVAVASAATSTITSSAHQKRAAFRRGSEAVTTIQLQAAATVVHRDSEEEDDDHVS